MFIGIDGEGKNSPDGSHRYTLLVSSSGEYIADDKGLTTRECFDFLLAVRGVDDTRSLVGFSVDYDINMMLGDFSPLELVKLWKTTQTTWIRDGHRYCVEYIPAKHLRVTRYHGKEKRSVTLWDTWGFFQSSFVQALKKWGICDESVTDRIQAMKEQRGDFAYIDDAEILTYCQEEVKYLADLMTKLDTLFKSVGIALNSYQGGGSAAAALLTRQGVKKHVRPIDSEYIQQKLHCAYFGGRSEVFQLGEFDRAFNYDINSAYPASSVLLPSLRGRWLERRTGDYTPGIPYSLWRVRWSVGENILAPFPYRREDGSIGYYRTGEGWYHGVEVDAAYALYPKGEITVYEGLQFVPDTDENPFAFIRNLYQQRLEYKRQDDMRERPIKLALNSVYGKTAQGRGYNGDKPPFQSFLWAGLITATTRAQILRAAYLHRRSLIAIATDGLFLTEEAAELPISENLGEWECGEYVDFFIAQAGVYTGVRNGDRVTRNRGFSTRELDFVQLRQRFSVVGIGAKVSYTVERFIKLGACIDRIAQRDYSQWRRWNRSEREVKVTCGTKFPGDGHRLVIGTAPDGPSHPYTPKAGGWLDWEAGGLTLEELEDIADGL